MGSSPGFSPFRLGMDSAPFLFATGIENSYPKLAGGVRIDQMEKCGHYERWEEDFALVSELGIGALRYGPPYYRTHQGPDRFEWDVCDAPMTRLRALGIEVIADLCHFGVPDWLGGFQDEAFPVLFADYARAFARRYPWVRFYTPINEIFICASFSALRGWWNECEANDAAFVWAMRNLCMAHELAVEAILLERPDAVIVQSESIEHFHPAGRGASAEADRLNGLKFLSLDLTLGHELAPGLAGFLNRNRVTSNDLSYLREKRAIGQRWIGLDYYASCEHRVTATGRMNKCGRRRGLRVLANDYYARYRLPLFHCETNAVSSGAEQWLSEQWREVRGLIADGIPIHGFTWYSLTDQIDWQYALRVEYNHVHPVGLYDLNRHLRPVGAAYRSLIGRWSEESREGLAADPMPAATAS